MSSARGHVGWDLRARGLLASDPLMALPATLATAAGRSDRPGAIPGLAAGPFSWDEDLAMLDPLNEPGLVLRILRAKSNKPEVTSLVLHDVRGLERHAWKCIGGSLRQNTHVEVLVIRSCSLHLTDLFCSGLQENTSIKKIVLDNVTTVPWQDYTFLLGFFIQRNPSLTSIALKRCSRLGAFNIDTIAPALRARNQTLEILDLSGNGFGDMDLDELVAALVDNSKLWTLTLDSNELGSRSCTSLAELLRNRGSNLRNLHLRDNSLSNESASKLAGSLAGNAKLKCLDMKGNADISSRGWKAMSRLVFDHSSIENLLASNHTVDGLGVHHRDGRGLVDRALGVDDANIFRACLDENRRGNKVLVARRKILWAHVRGQLDLGHASIVAGAMPTVLAWIADDDAEVMRHLIKYHDPPIPQKRVDVARLDSVYRILRSTPEVFG